jgi:hypothetical protein
MQSLAMKSLPTSRAGKAVPPAYHRGAPSRRLETTMADVKKLIQLFEAKAKAKPSPKLVKVPPRTSTGPGKPLPSDVRQAAEKAFGADFSKVRIHEDASVKDVAAKAYVSGHDIVFAPGASSDPALLAHELAHVVQQKGRRKDGEGAI